MRDKDTIELGAIAIRLNGLAAPEWDEPGGEEASDAMRDLVRGKEITCELDGDQTYDRCAAIGTLEGADIAAELVELGLARGPRAVQRRALSGGRRAGRRARLDDQGNIQVAGILCGELRVRGDARVGHDLS